MHEEYRLLLEEALQGLFSAGTQMVDALPALVAGAGSASLRGLLDAHAAETEQQLRRLEQVADMLGVDPRGAACEDVEGMLAGVDELIAGHPPGPVLDAALLGAVRRLEHHAIAAYGTFCALAHAAGLEEVAALLCESGREELAMDELLSRLAAEEVNPAALRAAPAR